MIDELKNKINEEEIMISELNNYLKQVDTSDLAEKKIYWDLINSLIKRIRIVNNNLPNIIKEISLIKKLNQKNEIIDISTKLEKQRDYFKELNISKDLIKKLKRRKNSKEEKIEEFKKISIYGKFSNKFFLSFTRNLISKGKLVDLSRDVKKSNIDILSKTYISMMFMTSLLSLIFGFFVSFLLLFFELKFGSPFISYYGGNYLKRFFYVILIPIILPLIVFLGYYVYPGAEKKAIGRKIDNELPFVVVHMGSISGSGIEPLEMFKIVGLSKDYKYAGKEIKKLLNQTNVYGYDLTTALRNVAYNTPSKRLSELLTGVSVTINSGGDIKKFFEKRSESLLLEYRLEREKSTKSAETFMDLYISIVIATPMILLMILIIISVSGVQIGFSPSELAISIIGVVVIINILFLTFLHLREPTY